MIQVFHKGEQGYGLEINEQNKLQVKAGRNVTVDESGVHVTLPESVVDVKLKTLTFEGGKLKATLTDESQVEVDFTAQTIVEAVTGADDGVKGQLVDALLPKLKEKLKGEALQNLAGETKGYLLAE